MRLYLYSITTDESKKDYAKFSQQNIANTLLRVQVENNFITQFLSANMISDV